MKPIIVAFLMFVGSLVAQENPRPARPVSGTSAPSAVGDYASDIAVVHDAQEQALEQARQMLEKSDAGRDHAALETAIKEMERAQAALADAKNSREKLPAALAAEQAAYQALLKVASREYNMSRSRSRGQQGGSAGQASQRQMDQLDMQREEKRYETESQASAPKNAKQREQLQTADRLKELSQRQQDLNGRLRELQTALQAARTEQERDDIQRQLKRLQDEQRQMLANVDELRQKLEQSPNASSQADARKQLEQTRSDMERAAQQMEGQSPSEALASGTRAQERMQNLRDDLRKQTSSQFAEQMRELRSQARELTRRQDEIARGLDSLNNGERKALDNSAERQEIVRQIDRQQTALTNLMSGMRSVTEQAEATEPLLSKQLYDTLRRADQMRTENLLQVGRQLTDRGFLPQAGEVERATRTNLTELARSVEHAAESVLGSEADALRFAQKELEELTRQAERDIAGADTNAVAPGASKSSGAGGQSNQVAGAQSTSAGNNSQAQQPGDFANSPQNGNSGEQSNGKAGNGGQASAANPPGAQGQGGGNRAGRDPQEANPRNGGSQPGEQARANGANGGGNRLRQLAEQLGDGGGGAADSSGPIMGNNYVNWSDRLRDLEQVVDPADLRNQLATVRERASAFRGEYRDHGRKPQAEAVRKEILAPLTHVRVWLQEELVRKEKSDSLVPLDRDPVPENYAELVRKYYEQLGSAQ